MVKDRRQSANRPAGHSVCWRLRLVPEDTVITRILQFFFSFCDYINNILTAVKTTNTSLLGTVGSSVRGWQSRQDGDKGTQGQGAIPHSSNQGLRTGAGARSMPRQQVTGGHERCVGNKEGSHWRPGGQAEG